MTEQVASPINVTYAGDAASVAQDCSSTPSSLASSKFPQTHSNGRLSLLSNKIIASCSKIQLSATTTILTTTAAQSSKLRCSDNGCLANPRSSDFADHLARAAPTSTTAGKGEAAPPAIGTCIVAAFGLPAAEHESGSTTSSSRALLDDMSLRRHRKRDIFLNELAAWRSQVKDAFGSFLERDNSIEPVTVTSITASINSQLSHDIAAAAVGGAKRTTRATTGDTAAPPALTKATTVQQQSALTSFHNRVLKRKHNRKLVEDLFVPIDVRPITHVYGPIVTAPVVVAAKSPTTVSPAPVRESNDRSGTSRHGSGNDLAGPTASLTLDSRQGGAPGQGRPGGAAGAGEDGEDDDKKPKDDDVDGDNVEDEDDCESEIEDEESWNEGYRYWKQQRRQWTAPVSGNDDTSGGQVRAHAVHQIVPELYPRVYHLLVNEGRRLKEPVNLSDATKILVAGWRATGQWPPQPGPPDPLIGSRKK
ncbi:hypothetical protein V1525DRAFT_397922 [Lipomyces kononenkoae]|uniref:Uncharacterized protein n=1 Tax=Lipomyces kononenkoae TaxID=34357 RepID=A0ACC3T9Q7_LIPKO